MTEIITCSIIYQGSKFYWRTRNNIDVAIVSHTALSITEVIAYEPALDVEAEHIYLDSTILYSKLNQVDIEAKFSFAKQNNVPHTAQFELDVMARAISDYILSRLLIKSCSKEEKLFSVQLQVDGAEPHTSVKDLVCNKPEELVPYEMKHHKLYSGEEINEALQALEEAKCNLEVQCAKAMEMQAEVRVPMSHRERWRIPVVLGKLAKNKALKKTDNKIWTAVAQNLKTQEDVDNLTKVTLRIVTPPDFSTRNGGRVRGGRTPTNGVTPNRSPCSTPRVAFTPRASSQRIFNGTASSQNRAMSIAEKDAPRKQLKRASSKGGAAKSPRKISKRVASKRNLLDTSGAITTTENNPALSSGGDSGVANTSDHANTFVGQITAGIASFAATLSAKLGGSAVDLATPHGADATDKPVFGIKEHFKLAFAHHDSVESDSSVCTPQTNGTCGSVATDDAPLSRQASLYQTGDAASRGECKRIKPARRGAFFGSFLSSILKTVVKKDDWSVAATEEASTYSGDRSASQSAEEQPSSLALSHKQTGKKRRGDRISLSAALAAWFPWTHSASVVPLDLPEYVPVE